MYFFWGLLIAWIAFILGYLTHGWVASKYRDGLMIVEKDKATGRLRYSLILEDLPEIFEFKRAVVFHVVKEKEEKSKMDFSRN